MADNSINVRERLLEIEENVMRGLTPFQRATVNHIAELYKKQRRVLVADEVGLGKTLIARGVISKIACMRSELDDDLVKVVYICSNASIAAQNIRKLSIDGDVELAPADTSRLSMQHLTLARERGNEELHRRYIQITPLTPATSFSITSGTGTLRERALMYAVLEYDERFASGTKRNKALGNLLWDRRKDSNAWGWKNWWCAHARDDVKEARRGDLASDEESRYPNDVLMSVERELAGAGDITFDGICDYLDSDKRDKHKDRTIIIALRRAFSKASVDLLDPDFVIMDEFQRFRNLISSEETETALLARRFLSGDTRVLLLSATPFRLYSTDAELDSGGLGDSYHEFLEVMGFLGGEDEGKREEFSRTWGAYTLSLRSLGAKACDVVSIRSSKAAAEDLARNYIARTERQSTGELGAIASNRTMGSGKLSITHHDVQAYIRMRRLMRSADIRRGLMSADFVKSCPFPLSFMSGYKLYEELEKKSRKKPSLISADKRADGGLLWLRNWDISSYGNLSVGNARYRALWRDIAGDEGSGVHPEQLMWVPASRPYYKVGRDSPYAGTKGFSKMILFSSWAMVPPSLACILSYQFERKNVMRLESITGNTYRYFKDGIARDGSQQDEADDVQMLPHRRVRFDQEQRTAFLFLYPSRYLASLMDVSEVASSDMTLAELRRSLHKRIATALADAFGVEALPREGRAGTRASIDWYIMSAIRLDEANGHDVLGELLGCSECDFELRDRYKSAASILNQIASAYKSWDFGDLGRYPADLVDVLVDAAIASPAVCALRTYSLYSSKVPAGYPFEFGYAFLSKMNTASATLTVAAVMERKDVQSAHWKNLLAYSCEGNLQAVIDEYAYLQRPMDMNLDSKRVVRSIHRGMVGSGDAPDMYTVETRHRVNVPKQKNSAERIGYMYMRTNIASAFMEMRSKSAEVSAVSRSELRNAFNSPFRPFVLVSTSVGQEGLDFHRYCRKICHWNLPSNPIDLEQREGRINRYQGLSVRQSIVERYGARSFESGDIWKQLFEVAEQKELEREGVTNGSGLLPYWGVSGDDDVLPVERYVYLYPFSRDEALYQSLLDQVYRYRAVLGQPNQEELLRMLQERVDEGWLSSQDLASLYINLCPYVWREGS